MKLTKAQRAQRDKASQQAAMAALRVHFTGEQAGVRRWRFLRDALLASVSWFARLVCLASWAAVAGVLVGPEHAMLFKLLYAWLVSMPVERALSQAHVIVISLAWELFKVSLLLGTSQKLFGIVKPALQQAMLNMDATQRTA
ncbi:MAG: hypothetical protein E6R08_01010 [Nevskiaceae bacterium]|nr:MAG: hypothetical protein E6R08_01010 [Nevskiaceae bacterium]